MKNTLQMLLKLSEIDAQIEELDQTGQTVPAMVAELERRISALEAEVRNAETRKANLEASKSGSEDMIREKTAWIEQRETMVKDIKTTKEYQAALKEVSLAKKEISDRQSQIATLTTSIEAASAELDALRTANQPQIETLHGKIAEQKKALSDMQPDLDEKRRNRKALAVEVDAKVLAAYNQVQKRISPALSKAVNFVCTECGSRVQPQLYNQLFTSKELLPCPRCKRILYLDEVLNK